MHDTWIQDLARASKGDLGLSSIPMDGHRDTAFAPLMIVAVEPAPLLY
jgi:hypothetical protein